MRSGFVYIVCVLGIQILPDISKADVGIDNFFHVTTNMQLMANIT